MCCFHAVYWPAILLGAGLPLPRRITVHGFLLQRGGKISKSGARAVALDDLLADFGTDGLRYYLLREHPLGPDGDFSYDRIVARYNADLANTLGNLVARVTALVSGPVPATSSASSSLSEVARRCVDEACSAWDQVQPSEALAAVWRLVAATNSYLVAAAPWRLPPDSADRARVLGDALEALRIVAILASPAIPGAAAEIWRRLGLPGSPAAAGLPEWGGYPGGRQVTKSPPLFPRLC